MTVTHSGPNGTAIPHSSNIKVIIVGLGVAGLTAAIECHRKGHTVIGLEKTPKPTHLGKSIYRTASGTIVVILTQLQVISLAFQATGPM